MADNRKPELRHLEGREVRVAPFAAEPDLCLQSESGANQFSSVRQRIAERRQQHVGGADGDGTRDLLTASSVQNQWNQ